MLLILIITSIAILPNLVAYFLEKKGLTSRRAALFILLLTQFLSMLYLWVKYVASIPSAASIIMPGVIAIYLGILLFVALVDIPFFMLFARKREHWVKNRTGIIRFYSGLLLLVCLVNIYAYLEVSFGFGRQSPNVIMYGKVVDIDDKPVRDAIIKFSGCKYRDKNEYVTDINGEFKIRAHCYSKYNPNLNIYEISDSASGKRCLSQNNADEILRYPQPLFRYPKSLSIGNGVILELSSSKPNHYKTMELSSSQLNPYKIVCVWDTPKNLIFRDGWVRLESHIDEFSFDVYAEKLSSFVNEEGNIKFEIIDNDLKISIKNGAIQYGSYFGLAIVAPKTGYQTDLNFDIYYDPTKTRLRAKTNSFYFKINDNFGFMSVKWRSTNTNETDISFLYVFNTDGSRNLVYSSDNHGLMDWTDYGDEWNKK